MRVALTALFFYGANWVNSVFIFKILHAIICTFVKITKKYTRGSLIAKEIIFPKLPLSCLIQKMMAAMMFGFIHLMKVSFKEGC